MMRTAIGGSRYRRAGALARRALASTSVHRCISRSTNLVAMTPAALKSYHVTLPASVTPPGSSNGQPTRSCPKIVTATDVPNRSPAAGVGLLTVPYEEMPPKLNWVM